MIVVLSQGPIIFFFKKAVFHSDGRVRREKLNSLGLRAVHVP